jgi:signal transduction histidine kinase
LLIAANKTFGIYTAPNEEQFVDQVVRYTHKDGSTVLIHCRGIAIRDNTGKPIRMLGAHQDISGIKNREPELIKAKEKAEESDLLKSAFLANMSHEIRTPMNGIMGFAELLKNPRLSDDQQQQYIEIIEKSGERMLGIINDIRFNKDVVIIAQTAKALKGDRQRMLDAGCDEYLAKPVKREELNAMIKKIML